MVGRRELLTWTAGAIALVSGCQETTPTPPTESASSPQTPTQTPTESATPSATPTLLERVEKPEPPSFEAPIDFDISDLILRSERAGDITITIVNSSDTEVPLPHISSGIAMTPHIRFEYTTDTGEPISAGEHANWRTFELVTEVNWTRDDPIQPGEELELVLPVTVEPEASGVYRVPVRIEFSGGGISGEWRYFGYVLVPPVRKGVAVPINVHFGVNVGGGGSAGTGPHLSDDPAFPGDELVLELSIRNAGVKRTDEIEVAYERPPASPRESTDKSALRSPTGKKLLDTFFPGEYREEIIKLTVPSDAEPGQYTLRYRVKTATQSTTNTVQYWVQPPETETPTPSGTPNVEIISSKLKKPETSGGDCAYIIGEAKNKGTGTSGHIDCIGQFYDSDDNRTAYPETGLPYLKPGEVWEFYIPYPRADCEKVESHDVQVNFEDEPPKFQYENIDIVDTELNKSWGDASITGTIQNKMEVPIDFLAAVPRFWKDDVILSYGWSETSDVPPGEDWSFEANYEGYGDRTENVNDFDIYPIVDI